MNLDGFFRVGNVSDGFRRYILRCRIRSARYLSGFDRLRRLQRNSCRLPHHCRRRFFWSCLCRFHGQPSRPCSSLRRSAFASFWGAGVTEYFDLWSVFFLIYKGSVLYMIHIGYCSVHWKLCVQLKTAGAYDILSPVKVYKRSWPSKWVWPTPLDPSLKSFSGWHDHSVFFSVSVSGSHINKWMWLTDLRHCNKKYNFLHQLKYYLHGMRWPLAILPSRKIYLTVYLAYFVLTTRSSADADKPTRRV